MTTKKDQVIGGLRALVIASYLSYAPYYLYWRLGTFNTHALVFSWIVWGAEVFGYVTAVLHVFMVSRLTLPVPPPAPEGLSVDVFITTFNESASLLTHSLLAARRMDYPHETWLLDDGNRPDIAALAEQLGCRYLAREHNSDAKAGNLNNALVHSRADFVAVFDADHVPHRDFLTKTLGFFGDPKVAFVQTPQDFYNLDSFQHRRHRRLNFIWSEQSLFFRIIQRGKDRWNAAFFCGSCAVVRVSALDAIGGFATGTVTEDLHTSLRLHKKGYRSVYYPESLAFGLAPNSITAFLSQRRRWGQGAIQVWRREGMLFTRGLTMAQRLNYLASVLTYFDGWQKAIFYAAPIVVLTTGVMPIRVLGWDFLRHFIPFYILCFWAYEEAGRGYGRTLLTEQYNMARFATFLRATLEGFRGHLRFRVTPKQTYEKNNPRAILPQVVVLAASLAAIVVGAVLWVSRRYLTAGAFEANVIWASINLGLAGSVVRFTLQRSHRRHEYRFPIPLPAVLDVRQGERIFGLINDISADGCQFVTETAITDRKSVKGELFLPAGRVAFRAGIRRVRRPVDAARRRAGAAGGEAQRPPRKKWQVGLRFRWRAPQEAAELEHFLYGSDIQWGILDLRDAVTTPLAWLVALRRRRGGTRAKAMTTREWLPVVYRTLPQGQEGLGVLARADWRAGPAKMILFAPPVTGTRLNVWIFDKKEGGELEGSIDAWREVGAAGSRVYLATVSFVGLRRAPRRRRRWAAGTAGAVAPPAAVVLAVMLSAVLVPRAADAQTWLGMSGIEAAAHGSGYGYVGAIVPVGSGRLGQGWVTRYWLDWVQYHYDANGTGVRANAPGGSAAVGYQTSAAWGYAAAYLGAGYRNTVLEPPPAGARVHGGQASAQLSGEIDARFARRWRVLGGLQYAAGPDSYWTRAQLVHAGPRGAFWPGVEIVLQGDPDYRAVKLGFVIDDWRVGERTDMNLSFGAVKYQNLTTGPYAGIEFVRSFGGN